MAIIYSYPQIGELATNDTIAISDASNGNKTKSVTVGQLLEGQATIVQVDDRVVTGASFNTSNGLLTLTRNGGEIPSVTTNLDGRYALTTSIPTNNNQLTNGAGYTTFDGQYSSLTGAPTLAAVATSGSYNDLSDQPTIPTNNNQLINGAGYTTNLGVVQTLTTTGTSGAATLVGGTLNIPQYSSGGGSGVTSIIAGTGISILPGTGVGDVQITNTLAQQSAYDTQSFFSGSGGTDSLAFLFNGNASDQRILIQNPDTDKLWVVLDLVAYLDTSGGTYTANGDLYVGPDVATPSEGIGIKIPATFLNSTTNKVIGIRCAMDYEVAENDIKGTDLVLKAFSTPVSISSTGATLKISYTRRLLTNLFD